MAKEILIVDDDPDDLESMQEVLEGAGYVIKTAQDGAQALGMITGNGFNLILIDIRMPTLSGYDLLRIMREKLNHHVKMVYVSIVPAKEVVMDEVDGFVQKPLPPALQPTRARKPIRRQLFLALGIS